MKRAVLLSVLLVGCGSGGLEPGIYDVEATVTQDTCGTGLAGVSNSTTWTVSESADVFTITVEGGFQVVGDGERFTAVDSAILDDGCTLRVDTEVTIAVDGNSFSATGFDALSSPDCSAFYAPCRYEYAYTGSRR